MFKSIKQSLEHRRQSIGRQTNAADVTQQAVLAYLQQNYSDTSARISVRYQDTDGTLVIVTTNKTLAGELSLHVSELQEQLATQGVRVTRIVIR
jgi:ABC-type branched-subunit amino acid transport system substrate-binding protein